MSKPCADVPDQLWLSDFRLARPGGNKEHVSRMPWTSVLLARCRAMRDMGETWVEVARMLHDQTGVKLSDGGVSDYLMRQWWEK